MKLILVFLATALLQHGYSANAQTISISKKNISLHSVLKEIRVQTGYDFFFEDASLGNSRKIDINIKNGTLEEVLKSSFQDQPLTYSITGNAIVVKMKKQTSKPLEVVVLQKIIQGAITDEQGEALVGVSVVVKGTTKATTTNSEGLFTIEAESQDILMFSYIGFVSQEVKVDGQSSINILMKEDASDLDEVVITAFGKRQSKEAIVGSVTSISAKELKIPSSNLTTAFAGRMAGVIAYQRSGEPGADDASFFVRGVTTFGNGSGSPLILIDNIELTTTDLARLQPDDIESFSILKDASATSLYGARGANGVIFVTTKQGQEGRAKLSFRVENSISTPTQKLRIADPITHMKLFTEAQLTRDPLASLFYPQNTINKTAEGGSNPYVYPATDWFELMFKDKTSNQRANLSVRGGGKSAQYYVAGSYSIDNGILNVDPRNNFNSNVKLNSYQLRSNVNMQLTPKTELVVRMFGVFDDYKGPIDGGTGMYQKALRTSPTLFAPYYFPDEANSVHQHVLFGNYRSGNSFYLNPYAEMLRGYKEYSQSRMLAQIELNQDLSSITQGLNMKGLFSTNRYSYFDVSRAYGPYFYNIGLYDKHEDKYILSLLNENDGPKAYEDIRPLGQDRKLNMNLYAQATLDYNRSFNDKHKVGGTLIGVVQQSLATTENYDVQSSLPHRNIGLSGRTAYSYDNRYFGEFNFGYNGSERFYKDKQFGFFPTIGLAWVVSNEKFWNNNIVSNLKIRGSYGLVGNDAIGRSEDRFFYLSNVNLDNSGRGAKFGYDNGYSNNGVSISRYPNLNITWEKSYQSNLALELGIARKVNIVTEIYNQRRKNILMSRASIPSTMGLSVVTMANVGEASSKGLDMSLDYTHNFNQSLWMIVRGSLTFSTSEFVKYEEPQYVDEYKSRIGQSINQTWGYIAERLFIDDKDVENSPKQNFGLYQAGDIKYRDVNGDGQITSLDMVPIGYPTSPEVTYGFGTSAGYKAFDFSIFFQGLGRESFWIDPEATAPFVNYGSNGGFIGENALLQDYADSYWSEERRDIYALWPRLAIVPIENNNQKNTWFMRDGSFLRVKSIEAGYTLPKSLTSKYKISNFRIYFSGSNLFTFSKFKLWDPEMGGNGLAYPLQKVYNLGVNLNF